MIRRYGCPLVITLAGCSSPDHPALNSDDSGYRVDSSVRQCGHLLAVSAPRL